MKAEKQLARLLTGLSDDAKITNAVEHEHTVEIFVTWDEDNERNRKCPFCDSTHCNMKDSGSMQTIRHLPVGMKGSLITFHKPRLICMDCSHTFFVHPWWVAPGMSISLHLFFDIYKRLTSTTLSIPADVAALII